MRSGLLNELAPDHSLIPGRHSFAASWPTLLIVDGDAAVLGSLVCHFEKRGFHVAAASTLADAVALCQRRNNWSLVITDYHLPDGSGWELCCWMQEQPGWKNLPFILTSTGRTCAALCPGAETFAKPLQLDALEGRVRALLERVPA